VFTGSTAYSVMTQQVKDQPPRLRSTRPDIPADLEKLVLDLLQKRPEKRPAGAEQVYQRLLPFAAELGALPGALQAVGTPRPVPMYAELVGRAWRTDKATPVPSAPIREPEQPETAITREELAKARGDAHRLIRESRFGQAAEILGEAEEVSRQAFGDTDKDVIRIRYDLATALFEGGDYRRAAPVYRGLVTDLTVGGRGSPDLLFDCRVKAATCDAMTGGAAEALEQLGLLLAERRNAYGDDPRTLELRKQIALLQLRSGRRQAARQTLTGLLADVRRLPGGAHPSPAEVADLIAAIRADQVDTNEAR
jgi:hypothetical protein